MCETFESGTLKRDEVFVTTKLGMGDCHKDGVLPALQKSLRYVEFIMKLIRFGKSLFTLSIRSVHR